MKYYMQQQYYNNTAKVRVYASSAQGGRKYMEDEYSIVHYKCPLDQTKEKDVLQHSFAFFGIFDGHGGDMAARYSRDNLFRNIIRQREFWSGDEKKICLAIHRGFVRTQRNMMGEVGKWPKTTSGLPSTAGTTASVVFIMNGNYYTGHVGDSRIVLGRQDKTSNKWLACPMTRDHKPESPRERKRIEAAGGQVMNKSGIGRVVWNRPKPNLNPNASLNSDPQSYDVIPFLAVARALGDLWSLNKSIDTFIVSPEPDVHCIPVDRSDRCLILASDGLWNVINNQGAVKVVQDFEETHKPFCLPTIGELQQSHASQMLDVCMNRWSRSRFRADNTTVLTIIFDREDDDNDQDDLSDVDSEVTDSEEEIDPEAQNRRPNVLGSAYLDNSHSFYDLINEYYDNDEDTDEEEDIFEKGNLKFIGGTIHEMNLTSCCETTNNHDDEVADVLLQVLDKVAFELDGISINDSQSRPSCDTPSVPKTESFNELTDEQLSEIRFIKCSNWDPSRSFLQNNYNTVLTIDRSVLGFKDYFSSGESAKSFPNKRNTAIKDMPLLNCKVVLHESQNTYSHLSTTIAEANCDDHSEQSVTNGQGCLDLVVKRATSPPPSTNKTPVKCAEVVSAEKFGSASSPLSTFQPLSSLDSNSSPYSYRLPKFNYKRKFEFVSELSASIVSPVVSSVNTDFTSSIGLVGHHFHSKRFCVLESAESSDYLSTTCAVKQNMMECNKNQVLTAATNE